MQQVAARAHAAAERPRVRDDVPGSGQRVGGIEVVVEVGQVHVRRAHVDAVAPRGPASPENAIAVRADGHGAVARRDVAGAAGDRDFRIAEVQAVERTARDATVPATCGALAVSGSVQIGIDLAVGIAQRQAQRARDRRDLRAVQVRGHVERGGSGPVRSRMSPAASAYASSANAVASRTCSVPRGIVR